VQVVVGPLGQNDTETLCVGQVDLAGHVGDQGLLPDAELDVGEPHRAPSLRRIHTRVPRSSEVTWSSSIAVSTIRRPRPLSSPRGGRHCPSSLMMIVTVKYVAVAMRADNRGEGGSFALLSLIARNLEGKKKWTPTLVLLGVAATCLFYGDAMITPAILILATGSLVTSTITRLNRAGDRARSLLADLTVLRASGDDAKISLYTTWLINYRRRSAIIERALPLFYIAIFLFVGTSLGIAIDDLLKDQVPWLSLVLVLGGALLLFAGTAGLVLETQLATGQLRSEIEASMGESVEVMEGKKGSPHIVRASS